MTTTTRRRTRLLTLLLALMLVAVACGGDSEKGAGLSTDPDAQTGAGGIRDTSTTAPPATTTTTKTADTQVTNTTAAPAATTTTAPPVVNVIQIVSETPFFDPQTLQVPQGQVVRWKNNLSTTTGIQFQEIGVASGDIPPGGTFDWVADQKGLFHYDDTTRPFATSARIQVF